MAHTEELGKREPNTQAAAQELTDILESLPAFEPCFGPAENWTEELRRKRFPVWDLWPEDWRLNPPTRFKDAWWAYGSGWLVLCDSEGGATKRCRVADDPTGQVRPQAVLRVLAARAQAIPDGIRKTLTQQWRIAAGLGSEDDVAAPEVLIRNEWHERRLLVREVMPRVLQVLDTAIRAVRQASGDPQPLLALKKDDLLHDETRDRALAQLREVPHLLTTPTSSSNAQRGPVQRSQLAEVERVLNLAHRHSLTFLMHACFSIGCYHTMAMRLDRDYKRKGQVHAADVQKLQEQLVRCREAASDLAEVYEPAWSLLVDAHRPRRGSSFAFECVYEMSRAAVANWNRIHSTVPGAELLDLLINTAKYILCPEKAAKTHWNDINAEFAIVRHKHGLRPELFRHPQADELAVLDAMIGDLLKPEPDPQAPESVPQVKPSVHPFLGNGGPAKTLDAICSAIQKSSDAGRHLAEGDSTSFHEALQHLGQQDKKKAKDYMAPLGRLCTGGWITRVGADVVLTALGASEGNRRRQRGRRR